MAPGTHRQFALQLNVYQLIRARKDRMQVLFEARGDRLSMARVVELLDAHADAHPMTAEFVENFKFRTRHPGRPKQSDVESLAQPTVSEEQLDHSEDDKEDTHTHCPSGEFYGISGSYADAPDNPRRRRHTTSSPEAPDEGEPLSGDGERGG